MNFMRDRDSLESSDTNRCTLHAMINGYNDRLLITDHTWRQRIPNSFKSVQKDVGASAVARRGTITVPRTVAPPSNIVTISRRMQ